MKFLTPVFVFVAVTLASPLGDSAPHQLTKRDCGVEWCSGGNDENRCDERVSNDNSRLLMRCNLKIIRYSARNARAIKVSMMEECVPESAGSKCLFGVGTRRLEIDEWT